MSGVGGCLHRAEATVSSHRGSVLPGYSGTTPSARRDLCVLERTRPMGIGESVFSIAALEARAADGNGIFLPFAASIATYIVRGRPSARRDRNFRTGSL